MNKLALTLSPGKKIFFASDFHLGVPNETSSREREKRIIRWLDQIEPELDTLFLVGDVFDFWFEYPHVIPKGFTRFLGKLAELRDKGIPIYLFRGNHDMWMFDYFPKEFDIPVLTDLLELQINKTNILVGHGDGLGPGDLFFKITKKLLFRNRLAQWMFRWLHPNIGMAIAGVWSRHSRLSNAAEGETFKGDGEWIWTFCKETEKKKHYDYYVFGHRHLPLDLPVGETSKYINLGEWVNFDTYAVFDGEKLSLDKFED